MQTPVVTLSKQIEEKTIELLNINAELPFFRPLLQTKGDFACPEPVLLTRI